MRPLFSQHNDKRKKAVQPRETKETGWSPVTAVQIFYRTFNYSSCNGGHFTFVFWFFVIFDP